MYLCGNEKKWVWVPGTHTSPVRRYRNENPVPGVQSLAVSPPNIDKHQPPILYSRIIPVVKRKP